MTPQVESVPEFFLHNKHMKQLHMLVFVLLVVGGLNWLLVGLFEMDLVMSLLGGVSPMLVKAVYVLVGAAAVYEVFSHKGMCRVCGSDAGSAM